MVASNGQYVIGFEGGKPTGGWIEQSFATQVGNTYQITIHYLPLYVSDQEAHFKVDVFSSTGELIRLVAVPVAVVMFGLWHEANNFLSFEAKTPTSVLRITETGGRTSALRFDEISVQSANPQTQIALYPGIRVFGLEGRTYSIEHKNSVDQGEWTMLKTFQMDRSPTLIFDEEGIDHPGRIYRSILLP